MGILSLLPSSLSLSFAGRTDSMFNFYACTSDATRRRPLSFCVLILPPPYTRSPRDRSAIFGFSAGQFTPARSRLPVTHYSAYQLSLWFRVVTRKCKYIHSLRIIIFISDRGKTLPEQYLCSITFEASMNISRAFWCDYHNWKSLIVKQMWAIAFFRVKISALWSFRYSSLLANEFWVLRFEGSLSFQTLLWMHGTLWHVHALAVILTLTIARPSSPI